MILRVQAFQRKGPVEVNTRMLAGGFLEEIKMET